MVAVPELENVIVPLACSAALTGVDARQTFTQGALDPMHQLPLGAHHPTRLVPYCPPVHLVVLQVLGRAAYSLFALDSRVSIFAHTLSIRAITLSSARAASRTASKLAGRPEEGIASFIIAARASTVLVVALAPLGAIIRAPLKLTRLTEKGRSTLAAIFAFI